MKRRDFLAAAAALIAGHATAAPNKNKVVAKKTAVKPGKPLSKATGKPAGKAPLKTPLKPAGPVAGLQTMQTAPLHAPALRLTDPPPPPWREHEIAADVSLPYCETATTLWLPLPIDHDSGWQRGLELSWSGNFTRAGIVRDAMTDLALFRAEWAAGKTPQIQVVSKIAVRDRQFDVTRRGQAGERDEVLRRFLRPAPDNAVRDFAEHIIGRIREPMPQARAIYDWLLEKGADDSEVERLKALLGITEQAGEALPRIFVGLCRSLEIPARIVCGLRLEANATAHCRAEYYAPYYGWIPVDPADAANTHNESLRKRMFGYWEMNWVALSRGAEQAPTNSNMPAGAISGAWAESGGKPVERMTYRVSSKRS